MFDRSSFGSLPPSVGVGYKPQHFQSLIEDPGAVGWLEIHAENYMGDGGRPIAQLGYLAERFAMSVHGVGLSIGGASKLDREHLLRLKRLIDRTQPAMFSEHLAWSTHDTHFLNDLLPLPYTQQTLDLVCAHIDETQNFLGRQMLLENPSSYLAFEQSSWSEPDFIREIVKRSGCGLLLDVNNVFVSSVNLGFDPKGYIDKFPVEFVREIHLAGHDEDSDELGRRLLIDSHGKPVDEPVWALYDYTLSKTGACATLVEWDNDVPEFSVLQEEVVKAASLLTQVV